MKKKIRIMSLALAATMSLSLMLSACSSSGNGNGNNTPSNSGGNANAPKESPATESTEPEKEVTLKFYFGGDKKAATDEVWSKVSEYVKSKGLNVKFDINFIPFGDFKDKMLVMAASGDKWDMNFDGDWLSYKQMAAKGSYMTLNDLLPEYAPNLYKKYQEQGTLGAATVNGNIVGLPWTMKMNERKFIAWRSDLTEKAGIDVPEGSIKTIEDLDKLLRDMKKAYPNEKINRTTPLSMYMVRDEWVDLNFHGLGFYLNDPTVKVQPVEQQPFYLEASKLVKTWYDENLINRDAMIDKTDGAAEWRNGKMLVTLTSHEWVNANPGFSDPTYKLESSVLYPDKKFVNRTALANVVAINRNSKNADRVLRFLDMIETDKTLYDLVQYGIEGKTYVLNGDTAEYPEGMDTTTSNYMEWGGQWAFWKPQFMRPTMTYGPGFWENEAKFASEPNNVNSPIDGLFLAEDTMKNEVAKRDAASDELSRPIEFGVVKDVDKAVNDYIEAQKKNGLDTIITETQKQIDAFLANKK
ncbi:MULTISPECIES: extracellular solute-binding protein [unclassified Paenibacillus]|uniref:extracellular solute-binding protein n=1 Tax=unclassified Paenibacillus TaxID=185978 RepID=UPI001043B7DC|nr:MULTISPECIES: extracellular solute-binding protein [unclassified Paenibacillus]NIK66588.1 putative aldouronate transport system substrate-binding protein [Paenibacillus sp. BK720]TCN00565.1 putative aldouronate transport system substrate-binding protein [Paenibacillus sp. BK033]